MAKGIERYYLKKQRTPKWADQGKINAIYRLSKHKGKYFHVDHIVPLVHARVCGLHCEANLQIVHGRLNMQKSNHTWPDMWMEQVEWLDIPEWLLNPQLELFR